MSAKQKSREDNLEEYKAFFCSEGWCKDVEKYEMKEKWKVARVDSYDIKKDKKKVIFINDSCWSSLTKKHILL